MKHSYIVVNKETRKAVLEFHGKKLAKHINSEKYEVLTAMQYLYELDAMIKSNPRLWGAL